MKFWNAIKSIASPMEEYITDDQPEESGGYEPVIKDEIFFAGAERPRMEPESSVRSLHKTIKMHFVIKQPTSFESEAEGIADQLLSGHSVMLNLEKVGAVQGRSFLEYLSGVVYARSGKPQKISEKIYLFTPYNVEVVGDLSDLGSLL